MSKEMVTKWLVTGWREEVKPVNVVSETAQFVTLRYQDWTGKDYDQRIKKEGKLFDTFEQAKAALVEDAKRAVTSAEASLQRAKDHLKKCNDLKAQALAE